MRHSGIVQITSCVLLCLVVCVPQVSAAPPTTVPPGKEPYVYACQLWLPHHPPQARALFDVYWLKERIGADDRRAIEGMGGVVVHEFNVAAVRARLWVGRIPPIPYPPTIRIETVGLPHDYRVNVRIHMPVPLSPEDRQFLTGVGAVITQEFVDVVLARVPDEAIPMIRAHPRVQSVWAAGQFGCLD